LHNFLTTFDVIASNAQNQLSRERETEEAHPRETGSTT
jgi:hypothetical protein